MEHKQTDSFVGRAVSNTQTLPSQSSSESPNYILKSSKESKSRLMEHKHCL